MVEVFERYVAGRVSAVPNRLDAVAGFFVGHRGAVLSAKVAVNEVESAEVIVRCRVVEFGACEGVGGAVVEHHVGPEASHLVDVAEVNYAIVVSVDFISAIEQIVE